MSFPDTHKNESAFLYHVEFIPLGTVAVGLGCVCAAFFWTGLAGFDWPTKRRRTILIRVRLEALYVVAFTQDIINDTIQFFFVRADILSVTSRVWSISYASPRGSPTITIRYLIWCPPTAISSPRGVVFPLPYHEGCHTLLSIFCGLVPEVEI